MPKQLLLLLAGLALLLAATVLGRQPASARRDGEARKVTTSRSATHAHARVLVHTTSRDHSTRTTIEDDDDADDDDDLDTAALAPPQRQYEKNVAPDAVTDERAGLDRPVYATTESPAPITGRRIRPSGEHRSTTDRPPRS